MDVLLIMANSATSNAPQNKYLDELED